MTRLSRNVTRAALAAAATLATVTLAAPAAAQVKAERTADGRLRIVSVDRGDRTARSEQARRGVQRQESQAERIARWRERWAARKKAERRLVEERQAAMARAVDGTGVEEPPFRIWSWQQPLGDAEDAGVINLVRVLVDVFETPEACADHVVDAILHRGLEHEQIAILLQHFGMGDGGSKDTGWPNPPAPALFWHWCDGLRHVEPHGTPEQQACETLGQTDASPNWWQTPWMSHGIAESRAWMERFIARYQERQAANPAIPDPSRFHFASEYHSTSRRVWHTREFHAMKSDPRWNSEPIPGYDGKTLAELYAEAGSPTVDPTRRSWQQPNLEWTSWYEGIGIQSADAAMNEAAYEPIRQAWPAAKSSNWRTSDAYDGVDDRYRRAGTHTATVLSVNRGFGDMQALVLYGKNPNFMTDVAAREKVMGTLRRRIEDAMFSFDGPHANFAPWTYTTGQPVTNSGQDFRVPADQLRRTIVELRSRGIHELLLWSGSATQEDQYWNGAADAIRDALAFSLADVSVERGDAPAGADVLELVRLRQRDPVALESEASGDGHVVELESAFQLREGGLDETDALTAVVYARSGQPDVKARVLVRDRVTRDLVEVGAALLDEVWSPRAREHRFERSLTGDDRFVGGDGRLELVLRLESDEPFSASVDHLTAYRTNPEDLIP